MTGPERDGPAHLAAGPTVRRRAARRTTPGRSGGTVALGLALVAGGALLGGAVVSLTTPRAAPQLVATTVTRERVPAAVASALPKGFTPPVAAAVVAFQHIPPLEVAIPAVGVRSKLIGLRLELDGSLQVPADYGVAGWYSDGSAPGDSGAPAVLVGHVDSQSGPGIFYRLPQVRAGDAVLVRRSDGSSVRFVVYRTADYAKDTFPARAVYAAGRQPELRLITCTGSFTAGHYLSNRVVYARLAPPTAKAPAKAKAPAEAKRSVVDANPASKPRKLARTTHAREATVAPRTNPATRVLGR